MLVLVVAAWNAAEEGVHGGVSKQVCIGAAGLSATKAEVRRSVLGQFLALCSCPFCCYLKTGFAVVIFFTARPVTVSAAQIVSDKPVTHWNWLSPWSLLQQQPLILSPLHLLSRALWVRVLAS